MQTTDLGLGAYVADDVGRPRRDAIADAVARVASRTLVRPDGVADVVVLVEAHAPMPARYTRLMGKGWRT
ncbi:hypothetical protein [Xylanimonas allomyrinae]|uniref:hypothetical protein n=1 Tax=Xylanimonas allomyrinae TaxID=2509459 RepID=UPI001FE741C4|nr:hypothetical protein [Xylanimonas allomyrinae]